MTLRILSDTILSMEEIKDNTQSDPLGLKALSAVVDRLAELKNESLNDSSSTSRFSLIVEQLENRLASTLQKYDLLKDRYALLKRSNAALCDELVWLRDQLDDLNSSENNHEKK